jgi:ABC-type bacteriocin/lantibiotic exporter with double-glycine peptidase domain
MNGRLSTLIAVVALASGCGITKVYSGAAVDATPEMMAEPGWIKLDGVMPILQRESADCGAAALTMVLHRLGEPMTLERALAELEAKPDRSIRAGDLRDLARSHGFSAFLISGEERDLRRQLEKGRPLLVGLVKPTAGREFVAHFEVVIGVHPERRLVLTVDPARGFRQNAMDEFQKEWAPTQHLMLVVIPPAR